MNEDRLVIGDGEWRAEIVQHWPDGGASARPTALDVLFYDLEDHDQWVGNFWIPFDATGLSRDRLRTLFRDADTRSWRDSRGRYWWIRNFRPGTVGPCDSGDLLPDGILSFHGRDSSGAVLSRIVAELPPIGRLRDDELERLLSGASSRGSVRPPPGGTRSGPPASHESGRGAMTSILHPAD